MPDLKLALVATGPILLGLTAAMPEEPVLFHLYAGLRGSMADDTETTEWTIRTRELTYTVRFTVDGIQVLEGPGRGPGPCLFVLRSSRPARWPGSKTAAVTPIRHLAQRTADEFLALHNHCWPCPVPLWIDGRRTQRTRYTACPGVGEKRFVELGQQLSITSPMTPVTSLLVRRELPRLESRPEIAFPWADTEEPGRPVAPGVTAQNRVYVGETWIRWKLAQGRPAGWLLLLYGAPTEGRLELTLDGAVVDISPLPWVSKFPQLAGVPVRNYGNVSVRAILPVSVEELDMTHFGVRRREELRRQLQAYLGPLVKETIELCLEHCHHFEFGWTPRGKGRAARIAWGAAD